MATPRSHIGWTDYSGGDANFIIGCEPVSAGVPFFAKQDSGLHPGAPLLINGEIVVQEFPHD